LRREIRKAYFKVEHDRLLGGLHLVLSVGNESERDVELILRKVFVRSARRNHPDLLQLVDWHTRLFKEGDSLGTAHFRWVLRSALPKHIREVATLLIGQVELDLGTRR